mmetsp:Transcript_18585/g.70554  ORF Transcript_18585/g.70554 Transcript_18585/m.70554 type:complete len:237 (+) Transcript_18585:223-933(+)
MTWRPTRTPLPLAHGPGCWRFEPRMRRRPRTGRGPSARRGRAASEPRSRRACPCRTSQRLRQRWPARARRACRAISAGRCGACGAPPRSCKASSRRSPWQCPEPGRSTGSAARSPTSRLPGRRPSVAASPGLVTKCPWPLRGQRASCGSRGWRPRCPATRLCWEARLPRPPRRPSRWWWSWGPAREPRRCPRRTAGGRVAWPRWTRGCCGSSRWGRLPPKLPPRRELLCRVAGAAA